MAPGNLKAVSQGTRTESATLFCTDKHFERQQLDEGQYELRQFTSAKGPWVVKFGEWKYWDEKELCDFLGWYAECVTLEGKSHGQLPIHNWWTIHIEIIGNIYETPALLEFPPSKTS
jgi:hypothetical protein